MEVPENLVWVIQGEAERLTQYLQTLPPEAWVSPAPVRREVRDVIGHLTWMAEFYAEAVSRAVHGDVSPQQAFRRWVRARERRLTSSSPSGLSPVVRAWEISYSRRSARA